MSISLSLTHSLSISLIYYLFIALVVLVLVSSFRFTFTFMKFQLKSFLPATAILVDPNAAASLAIRNAALRGAARLQRSIYPTPTNPTINSLYRQAQILPTATPTLPYIGFV